MNLRCTSSRSSSAALLAGLASRGCRLRSNRSLQATPSWTVKTITESSFVAGAENTITVTFHPSVDIGLTPRARVIAGLTGSQTGDNRAMALVGSCAAKFGNVGTWFKDADSKTASPLAPRLYPVASS